MSLWKFGDFEAEVDFTDAVFWTLWMKRKQQCMKQSRMFR